MSKEEKIIHQRANNHLSKGYTRVEIIQMLKEEGFSQEEAEKAIDELIEATKKGANKDLLKGFVLLVVGGISAAYLAYGGLIFAIPGIIFTVNGLKKHSSLKYTTQSNE